MNKYGSFFLYRAGIYIEQVSMLIDEDQNARIRLRNGSPIDIAKIDDQVGGFVAMVAGSSNVSYPPALQINDQVLYL